MAWEIIKVVGIIWIVVFSVRVSVIYIREKPILARLGELFSESAEDIENKVFSFDEALEPKAITNDRGIISIVNKAAVDLFGYTKAELKGKSINILIPPDEQEGFASAFTVQKESRRFKIDAVQKVGNVPVEVVLRKKQLGHRVFFLVIMRDRTQEVRIARNLQQIIDIQRIKIQVLMVGEELGNHGSWIWDVKKDTLITSPGYRRILGLDPNQAEFDRQYIRDTVYHKDSKIVIDALSKSFRGEPYDIVYRVMRRKDFKLVEIRSYGHPIMNENNVLIFMHGSMSMIKEIDIIEPSE